MAEILYDPYKPYQVEKLRFHTFQHPYVCKFVEELQGKSTQGLLQVLTQSLGEQDTAELPIGRPGAIFYMAYDPSSHIATPYPAHTVEFQNGGAYAQYNWELFFHVPLFVATRLMQDQRHEEAMRWFHYIFNPMTDDKASVPHRYWNFKPFRDIGVPEKIQEVLLKLQTGTPSEVAEIEGQIRQWRDHPFQPHRIARGRPGAYMKTVVMKYIDNLIAWGDKLFRRDTIESINEATQLYILAANLLGQRPQRVSPVAEKTGAPPTYKTLRKTLDAFSNAIVDVESLTPFSGVGGSGAANGGETPYGLANLAFCIPHNDKLISYWDTVEDRLFKTRHCMNIEGVVRRLPLFEPPIDPALLVRATAMGLDLGQVLDDMAAPLPHYRFPFMLQKAREFCEELKQLGGLLLSALEKRDAEKLSQIRAAHEKDLLKAVLEVKKKQVKEAEEAKVGLEETEALITKRRDFYRDEPKRLPQETEAMKETEVAQDQQEDAAKGERAASAAAVITPETQVGTSGGFVHSVFTWGFPNVIAGIRAYAQSATISSLEHGAKAQNLERLGQLLRRDRDYKLQEVLADQELRQVRKQITAADIRRQIAENELANHEKQIEQSAQVEEFLREKFTNRDLYNWMVSQVSAVYFQAYKLAYDMAKRAERAYRHELGIADSGFVQFGAWDSLHKGLLAGEKLSLDLRRLEASHLDQNKRTYELTKHVSLAQLNPKALIDLRADGQCEVDIPEALFDFDYPGHFMRRIKSASMTIPCVAGPYTSVSCTLTLLKHSIRRTAKKDVDKELVPEFGSIQSIATSGGRNDAGMFELNFRDERLLPFEGTGVVTRWRIELPTKVRQFDYDTISDVVFHVNYTALEGGAVFRQARENALQKALESLVEINTMKGLASAFSLRHDFSSDWHRLRQGQEVSLTISRDRLPYFTSVLDITIQGAIWMAKVKANLTNPKLSVSGVELELKVLDNNNAIMRSGTETVPLDTAVALKVTTDPTEIEDLWLIVVYALKLG